MNDMIMTESVPCGVFRRLEPIEGQAPVVIDISRSGRRYPTAFRPDASFVALHSKISMYVDELLPGASNLGATLLYAEFPVTFIDPNRAIDDLDPALLGEPWMESINPTDQSLKNGAGLIHSLGADKLPLYREKLSRLEVRSRIDNYYRPYHAELERLLASVKARFGVVFHLSFHCMSSIDPKNPGGPDARRPDICLGDRDGKTCGHELRNLVAHCFEDMGYGVSMNVPFKGSEIMRRYGSPESGVHSLQIEICKRLFMDEQTGLRNSNFELVQEQLGDLVRRVCVFGRSRARLKMEVA